MGDGCRNIPIFSMFLRGFTRYRDITRLCQVGGGRALEHWPAGLVVGAEDSAPWFVETVRLVITLTESVCLGVAGWIGALEPGHAPMRLAVGILQEPPQTGATHGPPPRLVESRAPIGQPPPSGRTRLRGRFPGRHRQHSHALSGGKSAAGAPGVAHPAGPGGRASESAAAHDRRDVAPRPSRWLPAHAMVALVRQSRGCADSERPGLGGWDALAQATPTGRVHQRSETPDAP